MNVFIFTGNLGKDAELRHTGDGTAVLGFSVAVKSGYGDKEKTVWVGCTIWGKRAEGRLSEYLTKGQKVAVTGELSEREYEGKKYLQVRVSEIELIGSKEANDNQQRQPAPQPQQQAANPYQAPVDDMSDPIPF